jgi:hypothetical protein
MKKINYIIFLLFTLIGCEMYGDNKLKIINKSDSTIYYLLIGDSDTLSYNKRISTFELFKKKVNNTEVIDTVFPNRILPRDSFNYVIHAKWEVTIDNFKDKKLRIFVFEKKILENYTWNEIVHEKRFSAKYSYSVEELKKINWRIIYYSR